MEVLSAIALIIITMLAVLGAYFLCESITHAVYYSHSHRAIILLAETDSYVLAQMIQCTRGTLPKAKILVVCERREDAPILPCNPDNVQMVLRKDAATAIETLLAEMPPVAK